MSLVQTCADCVFGAVSSSILSYTSHVVETITVSVIPHVTVFTNGSRTTSYQSITLTEAVAVGTGTGTSAPVTYTNEADITWTVHDATLTYPTSYVQYLGFAGAPLTSSNGKTCAQQTDATTVHLPSTTNAASFIYPLNNGTAAVPLPLDLLEYLDDFAAISSRFLGHPLSACAPLTALPAAKRDLSSADGKQPKHFEGARRRDTGHALVTPAPRSPHGQLAKRQYGVVTVTIVRWVPFTTSTVWVTATGYHNRTSNATSTALNRTWTEPITNIATPGLTTGAVNLTTITTFSTLTAATTTTITLWLASQASMGTFKTFGASSTSAAAASSAFAESYMSTATMSTAFLISPITGRAIVTTLGDSVSTSPAASSPTPIAVADLSPDDGGSDNDGQSGGSAGKPPTSPTVSATPDVSNLLGVINSVAQTSPSAPTAAAANPPQASNLIADVQSVAVAQPSHGQAGPGGVIIAGGQTLTAIRTGSSLVVAAASSTLTIAPGSVATFNGEIVSVPSSGGNVVVGSSTVALNAPASPAPTASPAVFTTNGHTITALATSNAVVLADGTSTTTLPAGSSGVFDSQTISVPSTGGAVVIGSHTHLLPTSTRANAPQAVITASGKTFTAVQQSGAIVLADSSSTITLREGAQATFDGQTVSAGASAVVVDGTTTVALTTMAAESSTGGVGGYINSGLGGAAAATTSASGTTAATAASATSGARVTIAAGWGWIAWLCFAGVGWVL